MWIYLWLLIHHTYIKQLFAHKLGCEIPQPYPCTVKKQWYVPWQLLIIRGSPTKPQPGSLQKSAHSELARVHTAHNWTYQITEDHIRYRIISINLPWSIPIIVPFKMVTNWVSPARQRRHGPQRPSWHPALFRCPSLATSWTPCGSHGDHPLRVDCLTMPPQATSSLVQKNGRSPWNIVKYYERSWSIIKFQ